MSLLALYLVPGIRFKCFVSRHPGIVRGLNQRCSGIDSSLLASNECRPFDLVNLLPALDTARSPAKITTAFPRKLRRFLPGLQSILTGSRAALLQELPPERPAEFATRST